jgi:rhomboid protease GluP
VVFDAEELALAMQHGFQELLDLGRAVLRAETAPLAALAVIQASAGDLGTLSCCRWQSAADGSQSRRLRRVSLQRSRRQCDERAFVLTAVDIAAAIGFDGQQYVLEVDEADAPRARAHLDQYERERVPKPPPPAPIPSLPNAWVGCAIYALVLIVIGLLVSNGFWRLDAFDAGEIDAQRVQAGQWWRAWTALTLHLDGAHLIANLAAGVWFGYLAARQIGSGITWLLVVTGAAIANLLEALLGPPFHRSVGASTAVFTALGLLAAHSWRLRARPPFSAGRYVGRRWSVVWCC